MTGLITAMLLLSRLSQPVVIAPVEVSFPGVIGADGVRYCIIVDTYDHRAWAMPVFSRGVQPLPPHATLMEPESLQKFYERLPPALQDENK